MNLQEKDRKERGPLSDCVFLCYNKRTCRAGRRNGISIMPFPEAGLKRCSDVKAYFFVPEGSGE